MPNGEQQEYKIKLGGQLYKFKADKGLSNEAAIDYASKKYPQFAEAYKATRQPKEQAPHWGFSAQDYETAKGLDQSKMTAPYVPVSPTGINVDPQHAKTEITTIASSLGGVGLGEIAALKAGGAVLPKIVQMVARASGAGVGAGTGALATGEKPSEALETASQFGAAELGGEMGIKAAGATFQFFRKLFKADPKRLLDLGELVGAEEKAIKDVQSRGPEIRKEINATYPEVQTPVRIMPAAKVAQRVEAGMVAEAAPKQVTRLADIGRARQQSALRLLSRARKVMEASPEGASDEVKAILEKAKQLQGLDFMDAQKLYSALGRAAASGHGWKMSGEQIFALNEARDALESSMHDALQLETNLERTAKAAGVMPEGEQGDFYRFRDSQTGGSFSVRKTEYSSEKIAEEVSRLRKSIPDTTQLDPLLQQKQAAVRERFEAWQPQDKLAQWEAAQARHKQYIDDFYSSNGALTPIMKAKPGERGEVLKHLLSKPETRVRATAALKRYGFDTNDVIKLATKWRDPVELNRAIADAARLEQVGQEAFGKQEAGAVRSRAGKYLMKKGLQAGGLAAGYELWKLFSNKSPSLFRSQP